MSTEDFIAHVQYDDWTGTAAADDAAQKDIADLLEQKKLYEPDKECLIAVSLYCGENHNGKVENFSVSAFVVDISGHDNVNQWLKKPASKLQARKIDLELDPITFLGLFKRFNVTLAIQGLNIQGRKFEID